MPLISNKILPSIAPSLNVTSYQIYNEDESELYTKYPSDSLKIPTSKQERQAKVYENYRNGKNVQIQNNTFNNKSKSNYDFNQNSTPIPIAVNNLNNLKNQNPIIDNEYFQYQNQKNLKASSKKTSVLSSNMINPSILTKNLSNPNKIGVPTGVNLLQPNVNPYIISQSNIPISVNLPMSIANSQVINQMQPGVSNMSFASQNKVLHKNDIEKTMSLNNQNILNNQRLDVDEDSDDELDDNNEDAYILELIHNKKFAELSDKDLLSNILIISKEQSGCRFLQQKIDDNPNFGNYELYPEIEENICELICDPFGNYLIQKMLDSLTTDKINNMMKNVIF